MLTLYHCTGARSLRAVWMLEEMGLAYDLVTLPFPPRALAKETIFAVNPLGTIPVLIDGTTRMTESAAICLYLAQRHGPTDLTLGADHEDYGAFLNFLFYADATLTFPQTIVLRYTALEPEERRLPQAAEDYRAFFAGRLKLVEERLADRDYLCAERFTAADIAVGYGLYLAKRLKIFDAAGPRTRDWYARITARPAFARADARR